MIEPEKIIGENVLVGALYDREREIIENPEVKELEFEAVGREYCFGDITRE